MEAVGAVDFSLTDNWPPGATVTVKDITERLVVLANRLIAVIDESQKHRASKPEYADRLAAVGLNVVGHDVLALGILMLNIIKDQQKELDAINKAVAETTWKTPKS